MKRHRPQCNDQKRQTTANASGSLRQADRLLCVTVVSVVVAAAAVLVAIPAAMVALRDLQAAPPTVGPATVTVIMRCSATTVLPPVTRPKVSDRGMPPTAHAKAVLPADRLLGAMANRRRKRTRSDDGSGFVVVIGGTLLVSIFGAVSSTIAKVFAAVIVAVGVAVFAVVAALAIDFAVTLSDLASRRPTRGLRATRPVLGIVLYPITLLRRVRDFFGEPPIRVETLGELLALTPTQFEDAIAQMLRDRGYRNVERCGGAGDLGVDITCRDPSGAQLAVQCKRYGPGNLVGSRDLQLFIGMITTHHAVDRGVYVTTSGFSRPAQALAKEHRIKLIDGRQLSRILGAEGAPLLGRVVGDPALTPSAQ